MSGEHNGFRDRPRGRCLTSMLAIARTESVSTSGREAWDSGIVIRGPQREATQRRAEGRAACDGPMTADRIRLKSARVHG